MAASQFKSHANDVARTSRSRPAFLVLLLLLSLLIDMAGLAAAARTEAGRAASEGGAHGSRTGGARAGERALKKSQLMRSAKAESSLASRATDSERAVAAVANGRPAGECLAKDQCGCDLKCIDVAVKGGFAMAENGLGGLGHALEGVSDGGTVSAGAPGKCSEAWTNNKEGKRLECARKALPQGWRAHVAGFFKREDSECQCTIEEDEAAKLRYECARFLRMVPCDSKLWTYDWDENGLEIFEEIERLGETYHETPDCATTTKEEFLALRADVCRGLF